MTTPRLRGPIVLLLLSVLVLVGSLGAAAPSEARPGRTRITATVPKTAVAGQAVFITGKIRPRSRNRDVQVQVLKGTTWALLGRTRTTKESTYVVAVTLPEGVQTVRLVARSKRAQLGSTKGRTVRVGPAPVVVPPPAPASPDRGFRLTAGGTLTAGQYLRSPSARYRLIMQTDGNLVVYDGATALWSAQTTGSNYAVMQGDGNFVVYPTAGGPAVWSSGTQSAGARLDVQDDGNAVVYQGATALWSWMTGKI